MGTSISMKTDDDTHPPALIAQDLSDRSPDISESANHRHICAWIIFAAVLLGMVGRLKQYVTRPSYWNDEAAVVANVIQRDWAHLLDRLDYAQAAPPLFLWSERGLFRLFGPEEYSLRLIPLLCGLVVLPLYAKLAWRTLPPASACWAVAWLCFFQKVVHRAHDVKQYSGDILVAVLLLLAVFGWKNGASAARKMVFLSLTAAVSLWFSFPVPFLFGALSLTLLADCFRGGRRSRFIWIAGNVIVLVSFLSLNRILSSHPADPSLLEFWQDSFPDFHRALHIPLWLAGEIYGLFGYPFTSFSALSTALAVLGIYALVKTGRVQLVATLLIALALALLAASLHRYPFPGRHRLGLYLIPLAMLVLGAGAEGINVGATGGLRKWWWILPLPLLLLELGQFAKDLVIREDASTTREVVEYVRTHRKLGEPIYLFGDSLSESPPSGRSAEFLCYWPDVPGKVVVGFENPSNIAANRFWVVYSLNRPETSRLGFREAVLTLFDPSVHVKVKDSYQSRKQSGAVLLEKDSPTP